LSEQDWCEAEIEAFAPDYDGSLWFIGSRGDFYAIDAQAKRFDSLWRVPEATDNNGRIVEVARSQNYCRFLINFDYKPIELWTYRLDRLTLMERCDVETQANILRGKCCVAISGDQGHIADQSKYLKYTSQNDQDSNDPSIFKISYEGIEDFRLRLGEKAGNYKWKEIRYDASGFQPGIPIINHQWLISPAYSLEGARILVTAFAPTMCRTVMEIFLEGSRQVALRFGPANRLAVADDRGRALIFNLDDGHLLKNLRI
jgi:hypothetical protein